MFKIIITESIYNKIIADETVKTKHPQLLKILKHYDKQLINEETTQALALHPENFYENPSSLYILNISQEKAEKIQSNYGVMCLSVSNPDVKPLIDVSDIFDPSTMKKKFKGWDRVLDSIEKLPSNSLVIKDRYLFSDRANYKGDGLFNIRRILSELLPKTFIGGEYHITVIYSRAEKHASYSFGEIAQKINNIAHQLRPHYKFMVEVFAINDKCQLYGETHDRQILSNYYLVVASHKLAAFTNEDIGTVHQNIIPWALFTESSLDGSSSAPLESIEQTIDTFRQFYSNLYDEKRFSTFSYALNGDTTKQCMGPKNRLLK